MKVRRILEELWYGNINPQDKQYQRGSKFDEALKMMCKNEDKLDAMLEEKEKEIFVKFKDCKDEVEKYNSADAFVTGFRLGARMVIEAFCEDDGFFTDIDA